MESENLGNPKTKTLIITGTVPEVTTNSISNITETSASSGWNVTSKDGIPVTVRGVCGSDLPNPTIDDNHTTDGSGTGIFESIITGLTADTKYYTRAYATNIIGTAYGADHQAGAVDDAKEASAGWYWQFFRKQGYKHDGTTITPGSTWESIIIEDSEWTSANDPCGLEFGNGWRIPTQLEWINTEMWSD
jgi:hypothetical protein